MRPLEEKLNDLFVKQAPPLARSGKRALVQYLPWINLLLGLLALYTVYVLWRWAHTALGPGYGGPPGGQLNFGIWLGLAALVVEALLYLTAFPGTRERKKAGWNLMFYALLVNVAYGILVLFTGYGTLGGLVITLVGSSVGLYLLFQIRSSYSKA